MWYRIIHLHFIIRKATIFFSVPRYTRRVNLNRLMQLVWIPREKHCACLYEQSSLCGSCNRRTTAAETDVISARIRISRCQKRGSFAAAAGTGVARKLTRFNAADAKYRARPRAGAWEAAWRNTECNTTRIYVRARIAPQTNLSHKWMRGKNALPHKSFGVRETISGLNHMAPSYPPLCLVRSLKRNVLQTEQMHRSSRRKKGRKGASVAKNCFSTLWPAFSQRTTNRNSHTYMYDATN